MKQLFLSLILSLTALSASAQTGTIEYSNANGLNGRAGSEGLLTKWTTPLNKNIDWDFQLLAAQTDKSNSVSSRGEIGLVPRYDLGFARFSVKAALGTRLNSSGSNSYYSIEPALTVPLNEQWSARVGYRYRDAVDGNIADNTTALRLGVSYKVTAKDSLTVRYDQQRGDSEQNSWNFAYTRRF